MKKIQSNVGYFSITAEIFSTALKTQSVKSQILPHKNSSSSDLYTMNLSPGLSSTQLDKTFNVRDLVNRLKDLKCKVCSKTFITKEHLVGHMKIHDTKKKEVNEKQVDLPKEPEASFPMETEVESSKGQLIS